MEETPAIPNMESLDLINYLERISSVMPNRLLKLEGFVLKKNHNEKLEIIIFKGFSSSTTHPIEIDVEKKVLKFDFTIKNFRLYESPLKDNEDNFIRENQNSLYFLDQQNWI